RLTVSIRIYIYKQQWFIDSLQCSAQMLLRPLRHRRKGNRKQSSTKNGDASASILLPLVGGGGSSPGGLLSGLGSLPVGSLGGPVLDVGSSEVGGSAIDSRVVLVLGVLHDGGGLNGLLLLLLLRIAVEVEIGHDLLILENESRLARDLSTEGQNLTGKKPPHESNRLLSLKNRRDSDVDKLQGRVGVDEGDDGDVHVRSLSDSLVVNTGVRDDEESGLLEVLLGSVGKATGLEATEDSGSSGVSGELEKSTLGVRAGRDDDDVGGVLNCGDSASSQEKLLPSLADVDDMDSFETSLVDVALDLEVDVGGSDVGLSGQELHGILLLESERLVTARHFT
ncbi:hypothetical protein PFISCL1PPCAC_9052, partial [Pristionchus fissidentatus]